MRMIDKIIFYCKQVIFDHYFWNFLFKFYFIEFYFIFTQNKQKTNRKNKKKKHEESTWKDEGIKESE